MRSGDLPADLRHVLDVLLRFGAMMLRGTGGTGYARVDWYTPDGLGTWGDGRLVILGTEGYIELRKYVDVAGRPGGNHLFVVDQEGARHVDASGGDLPYGRQLVSDILERTGRHAEARRAIERALRTYERKEHLVGVEHARGLLADGRRLRT